MKKSNDFEAMNPDDLEQQLARRPIRPLPVAWRAGILEAAQGELRVQASERPGVEIGAGWLAAVNARLSAILWPCPAAWAGLAAVWIVVFCVNYSCLDKSEYVARKPVQPAADLYLAVRQQRRELARLVETTEPSPAEEPKPFVPRPRGELRSTVTFV